MLCLVISLVWASLKARLGIIEISPPDEHAMALAAPTPAEEQKRAVRHLAILEALELSVGKISQADFDAASTTFGEER